MKIITDTATLISPSPQSGIFWIYWIQQMKNCCFSPLVMVSLDAAKRQWVQRI